MELNRTHELLVYADDVNMMDEKINRIKRNTIYVKRLVGTLV